mmetsp:Transcript_1815/g.3738  ORF Transcript_1815/g.3738 Transcript_1815/m.3738 type:complete len:238 (-) Transcript_1815:692-1405(-)
MRHMQRKHQSTRVTSRHENQASGYDIFQRSRMPRAGASSTSLRPARQQHRADYLQRHTLNTGCREGFCRRMLPCSLRRLAGQDVSRSRQLPLSSFKGIRGCLQRSHAIAKIPHFHSERRRVELGNLVLGCLELLLKAVLLLPHRMQLSAQQLFARLRHRHRRRMLLHDALRLAKIFAQMRNTRARLVQFFLPSSSFDTSYPRLLLRTKDPLLRSSKDFSLLLLTRLDGLSSTLQRLF